MSELVLASASPRRAALLQQLGLSFDCRPQALDESRFGSEAPDGFVQRLAMEKARSAWASSTGGLPVLGADTIVCMGDEIYGKPCDARDGLRMLAQLSGQEHVVMTAVAVLQGDRDALCLSSSKVRFRSILPAEAQAYWDTGEPADKAGGYAIQGLGAVFVEHLQGSYSGVVGLPLLETVGLLRRFGITVLGQ